MKVYAIRNKVSGEIIGGKGWLWGRSHCPRFYSRKCDAVSSLNYKKKYYYKSNLTKDLQVVQYELGFKEID